MQVLLRGDVVQKLRLASGLILFTFATAHFLNHAIGLVHIETMHELQSWRFVVTRSTIGTIILATALVTHITLALYKVATRATLRLPPWELIQLGFGVLIPFLLFPHIVNTRIANNFYNVEDNYLYELARLWPSSAILQSTLLLLVWIHGCMGIHFWLRLYRPYRAAQPVLLFIAIVLPLAALAGFMVSGRAVAQLIENPVMLARVKELTRWPNEADGDALAYYRTLVRIGFAGILVIVGIVFAAFYFIRNSGSKVRIKYLGGPVVTAPVGPTLLEISRANGIPHASICGGRARCSTCRVRIEEGVETLAAPKFPEAFTLGSIGAPSNVRLACQIRPTQDLTVLRLLRPISTGPEAVDLDETDSNGVEKPLAVLYVNMRGYSAIAAQKLPFDVVFLLNEFFGAVGTAINTQGGRIDRFIGDSLVAVFGQRLGIEIGCRQALRAARAIDLALDFLNSRLEGELGRPLEVGIGVHYGPLLIGRIGFGESIDVTVIGQSVKIAEQLGNLAKEQGLQLVLSRDVARQAGWSGEGFESLIVDVPGEERPISAVGVPRGRDLPASILASARGEGGPKARRPDDPMAMPPPSIPPPAAPAA
jgi:adenylate cyclase